MASNDRALQVLLELGDTSQRRTQTALFDLALRTALALTDADAVVLTTSRGRGERLVLHTGGTSAAALAMPADGSEVLKRFAESAEPISLSVLTEDPAIAATEGCPGVDAGPVLFVPVRRRDQSPFYVAAYRRVARARFAMNDTRSLLLLAAWLGSALDNLRLATGSRRLSVTDELTDVYNARYIKNALRREVRRASRFGQELSVISIDVDRFESHTEALGEGKSRMLLKELAGTLAQQVRSFDVMGRCGDDAFMLILPQTDREGATEVAERIRATIEQQAFSLAPAGAVTVSLGVAAFPQDASDTGDLVAAAERAVQRAKQLGRNRVEASAKAA